MQNTIEQFVRENELQKGDVVQAQRRGFGPLDHFLVYMGDDSGFPQFSANLIGRGTIIISQQLLLDLWTRYEPTNILYLDERVQDREKAMERAYKMIYSNRSYNLANYNCEHYASYVLTGRMKSKQSDIGKALAASLAIILFIRVLKKS